jgi:hypothetical protein
MSTIDRLNEIYSEFKETYEKLRAIAGNLDEQEVKHIRFKLYSKCDCLLFLKNIQCFSNNVKGTLEKLDEIKKKIKEEVALKIPKLIESYEKAEMSFRGTNLELPQIGVDFKIDFDFLEEEKEQ